MDLLDDYLMKCSGSEFSWPKNNCGHFSAGWVLRAEGEDKLAGIEFPDTVEKVAEFVATYGSMVDMVTKLLGRHPIPPSFAMRGDLVFSPLKSDQGCGGLLGICNGSTAIFLREGSGFVTLRMRFVTHAWRINQ